MKIVLHSMIFIYVSNYSMTRVTANEKQKISLDASFSLKYKSINQ